MDLEKHLCKMDQYGLYADEFQKKSSNLRTKIKDLELLYGEKRKLGIHNVEQQLDELRSLLRTMEGQLGNQPPSIVRPMMQTQRGYVAELLKMQRDLERAILTEGTFPMRNDPGSGNDIEPELDLRNKLLSAHERLDQTTGRLDNTIRVAAQTEHIGIDILTDLSHQRDQLERTRNNVSGIDDNIVKSRRILRGMLRRVVTNKIILILVIILLAGGIIAVVYLKWGAGLIKKAGG